MLLTAQPVLPREPGEPYSGGIFTTFFSPTSRWGRRGGGRSRPCPAPPHDAIAPAPSRLTWPRAHARPAARARPWRHGSRRLSAAPLPTRPQPSARLYLALVRTLRNPPIWARRRPSLGQTWRPRGRRKSRCRVVRCSPGRGRRGPPPSPGQRRPDGSARGSSFARKRPPHAEAGGGAGGARHPKRPPWLGAGETATRGAPRLWGPTRPFAASAGLPTLCGSCRQRRVVRCLLRPHKGVIPSCIWD